MRARKVKQGRIDHEMKKDVEKASKVSSKKITILDERHGDSI